jgi:hypothetical protein
MSAVTPATAISTEILTRPGSARRKLTRSGAVFKAMNKRANR